MKRPVGRTGSWKRSTETPPRFPSRSVPRTRAAAMNYSRSDLKIFLNTAIRILGGSDHNSRWRNICRECLFSTLFMFKFAGAGPRRCRGRENELRESRSQTFYFFFEKPQHDRARNARVVVASAAPESSPAIVEVITRFRPLPIDQCADSFVIVSPI